MSESEAYKREVTAKVEAGWRIESETPDHVTLVRRTVGSAKTHLIIAVLTIWWTMGVANLLYAAYKYFEDAERTVVWKAPAGGREEASASVGGTGRPRE